MYDETILEVRSAQHEPPCWKPLERFLPEALLGGFMYMNRVTLGTDVTVHTYKHSDTRRYLHLDDGTDAWEYLSNGRFRRMRHSDALEQVFCVQWILSGASEEERDAVRQALDAAWTRGNGDIGAGAHILPCSPACGLRRLPDLPFRSL